jgi:hypothetical protein
MVACNTSLYETIGQPPNFIYLFGGVGRVGPMEFITSKRREFSWVALVQGGFPWVA